MKSFWKEAPIGLLSQFDPQALPSPRLPVCRGAAEKTGDFRLFAQHPSFQLFLNRLLSKPYPVERLFEIDALDHR
jgi:hypothetical protein